MTKQYKKKKDISTKIVMTAAIQGCVLSPSELTVLTELVMWADGAPLYLSAAISADIKNRTGLTDSAFSTGLHRLKKKKLIAQDGKTISLYSGFNKISSLENLVISFVLEDKLLD